MSSNNKSLYDLQTPIIAKTRAACLDSANFSRADQFIPQRWYPAPLIAGTVSNTSNVLSRLY